MIKLKWSNTVETTIMNVYAPNRRDQHPAFWAQLDLERRQKRLPKPEFVLGDFNLTEESIDRSPPQRIDRTLRAATEAIRETRLAWNVQDQWRRNNPNGRIYTHKHWNERKQHYEFARLNRIYVNREHANNLFEWKTRPSAVPTDHWLVTVKFAPKDAPLIGEGRWTCPINAINDKHLMEKIIKKGIKAQMEIEEIINAPAGTRTRNSQLVWKELKAEIQQITKKEHRKDFHKINSKIKNLEKDLKTLTDDPEIDENDCLREEMAFLTSELNHLHKKTIKNQKETIRAQIVHHGEKPGGIWSAINKQKKPRDVIPRLKKPNTNPPQYERSTSRMAELARKYHDNLQTDGINEVEEDKRVAQIEKALTFTLEKQTLNNLGETQMYWKVKSTQVETAIELSKRRSSTGMDGCPYELWKALKARHDTNQRNRKPSFDIVKMMTIVFQDIQTNGVHEDADFALGWMCPIYKKKDRTEISNYRPITLLNTDYKILTKVLAMQLMEEIRNMLHRDQSGFLPKRSIFNNIRLANTIISYAELTETNGAIIALD